jgi:hypothetical protein
VLLPAWASAPLRLDTTAADLWWDVTHLAACLDSDLEAFMVFGLIETLVFFRANQGVFLYAGAAGLWQHTLPSRSRVRTGRIGAWNFLARHARRV